MVLDPFFKDGMVLQHDRPCISGLASKRVPVTVTLRWPSQQTLQTVVEPWKNLRFTACLEPQAPSQTEVSIEVSDLRTQEVVYLRRVLLGDVFYCTGQSNMATQVGKPTGRQWPVQNFEAQAALQMLNHTPQIRLLVQGSSQTSAVRSSRTNPTLGSKPKPQPDLWVEANPISIAQFSAVCWFCGSQLAEWLGTPPPMSYA